MVVFRVIKKPVECQLTGAFVVTGGGESVDQITERQLVIRFQKVPSLQNRHGFTRLPLTEIGEGQARRPFRLVPRLLCPTFEPVQSIRQSVHQTQRIENPESVASPDIVLEVGPFFLLLRQFQSGFIILNRPAELD